MRKKIIAGNWKMFKTIPEAVVLVKELKKLKIKDKEVVICPPFTALESVSKLLKKSSIKVGAQNMFYESSGAFTGEISPLMLKDLVEYVIIGHSERRNIFKETDEMINRKLNSAFSNGLIPIFCIGETLEERKASKTFQVLEQQIKEGLKDIKDISSLVIAYEPVWAIGTGVVATKEQAQEAHSFIRSRIATMYGAVAQEIRILYGGSVKPDNAKEILEQKDIDGVLVGGASLDAKSFIQIINSA